MASEQQAVIDTTPAAAQIEEMPQLTDDVADASDAEEPVLIIEDPPQEPTVTAVPEGVSQGGLGAHVNAPSFKPQPHMLTLFNTMDHRAEPVPCDLAVLTVSELRILALQHWGASIADTELHFGGACLSDGAAKAIDVGISNRSVVLIQAKVPEPETVIPAQIPAAVERAVGPMPPGVPMDDQWRMQQQQQQQMMQYNMALQANQQHMHLAAMAGVPMPPAMPPPSDGVFPFPTQPHEQAHSPDGSSPPNNRTITRVVVVHNSPQPTEGASSFSPQPVQPPSLRQAHVVKTARPTGKLSLSHTAADGEFASFAMTNEGARALISALDAVEDPTETIDQLLGVQQIGELVTHQHGSKVARALARRANPEQCARLLELLTSTLVDVAESTAGSDVLVDIIDKCSDASVTANFCLLAAPSVMSLCCSVNGRKVLLAVISHFPPATLAPLYEAMGNQLLNIATDQCGCITMQRVLDYTADRDWKAQLQAQILDNTMYLVTDPYGNYILQHCVKDDIYCSQAVGQRISGRMIEFACNKFSSNVVERVLQMGPEDMRDGLIEEVLDPHTLEVLMQDAYGNFVVQSSVDHAPPGLIERVRDAVQPLVARSPYGYRIESKLQRRSKRNSGGRRGGRNDRSRELPYHNAPAHQQHPRAALSSIQSTMGNSSFGKQSWSQGKNLPWHNEGGKQLPWNAAAAQVQQQQQQQQQPRQVVMQGWGDNPQATMRRVPQHMTDSMPQMALAP